MVTVNLLAASGDHDIFSLSRRFLLQSCSWTTFFVVLVTWVWYIMFDIGHSCYIHGVLINTITTCHIFQLHGNLWYLLVDSMTIDQSGSITVTRKRPKWNSALSLTKRLSHLTVRPHIIFTVFISVNLVVIAFSYNIHYTPIVWYG